MKTSSPSPHSTPSTVAVRLARLGNQLTSGLGTELGCSREAVIVTTIVLLASVVVNLIALVVRSRLDC